MIRQRPPVQRYLEERIREQGYNIGYDSGGAEGFHVGMLLGLAFGAFVGAGLMGTLWWLG